MNRFRKYYITPDFKGSENVGIRGLVRLIRDPDLNIDLDPDFQRGRVWSEQNQSDFVGFFLSGGMVPPVVVWDRPYPENMVVVDGKQRLTSLLNWADGLIPAHIESEKIFVNDLDPEEFRLWTSTASGPAVVLLYIAGSRKEVLDLYLRLNGCSVPHTKEEIARVRALRDQES